MRTIKFRGKIPNTHTWVYGDLQQNVSIILGRNSAAVINGFEVDPETVGQFTGLTDKNGRDIYEGDLLKYLKYPVTYEDGSFCATFEYDLVRCWLNSDDCNLETLEVIGNIHETK